jgi:DNA-binding NarL/FixJ family response regulator
MDIRKLNGNGLGDCQRIARASPSSRVVVLTSYLLQGEKERYRSLGARRCLLKTIGLTRLVKELQSIVR